MQTSKESSYIITNVRHFLNKQIINSELGHLTTDVGLCECSGVL